MDYLTVTKIVNHSTCAVCGGQLSYGITAEGEYEVICPHTDHKGWVREKSTWQRWKDGEAIPLIIENRLKDKEEKQMSNQLGHEKAMALEKYQGVRMLTKSNAAEILRTIWPKAPAVEVTKAALLCASYGLNPLMSHVFLIPFKGKAGETWATVMGIKATRLIASRRTRYSYQDGPRIMSEKEQEKIRGTIDPDNIWAITVLADEQGNKAPGYGSWPRSQAVYGSDKGNTSLNMAMIRSERNAFDRLIPGDMPASVDVLDERFVDAQYQEVPQAHARVLPLKTEGKEPIPTDTTTPASTSPASVEIPGGDIIPERFWDIAKVRLGYRTEEQVYKILGVPSIEKWMEPLETALDQLAQLKGCPDWRKLKSLPPQP